MAKMTKAEKLIVEQMQQAALDTLDAAEYPNRLMRALETATSRDFNMTLTVENGNFHLETHVSGEYLLWILDPTWDREWRDLDRLEQHFSFVEAEKMEATRVATHRSTALSKLTAEDRLVLGL